MKEKNSTNPLIARIAKLFNEQLALEKRIICTRRTEFCAAN